MCSDDDQRWLYSLQTADYRYTTAATKDRSGVRFRDVFPAALQRDTIALMWWPRSRQSKDLGYFNLQLQANTMKILILLIFAHSCQKKLVP